MNKDQYTTYMTDEMGPLPFCPGCGHHLIVKSIDKALVNLQKDPKDVVIVTDIGCIGLSDIYFKTNAFHGLHGRSVTYGCGLKLARPELTVIVIQGDGGCGIGGTHLLNVARRNIGITLIVANNFNYGMTGGQHSVTTPAAGITSTTPWGNVEGPMDLCGTVAAAGAPWVYRATVFDKDLPDVIAQAIEQPGFAMLDIWELCVAYYSPYNQFKKNDLFNLLNQHELKTGLIVNKPRPEYSVQYKAAIEQHKSKIKIDNEIEPKHPHSVKKQTGIVIAGAAGQKIKSTATLFGKAAMLSGLEVTQKDDYPITVMTGHSIAEIILSPEQIDYTGIDSPDYLVIISEEGLGRVKNKIAVLPPTCNILVDEDIQLPETKAQIIRLPYLKISKNIGRLTTATVALASMLRYSRLFPVEAFIDSISTFQKPAIAEINIKAVEAGAKL
ncbi:MAG: thiamine pyrophosphate-dependent enzyme [Methylococcaceae bacterium]|nr:thiamine pyrophosphate-dependent enzyme [Methylococcaceae bacterium]